MNPILVRRPNLIKEITILMLVILFIWFMLSTSILPFINRDFQFVCDYFSALFVPFYLISWVFVMRFITADVEKIFTKALTMFDQSNNNGGISEAEMKSLKDAIRNLQTAKKEFYCFCSVFVIIYVAFMAMMLQPVYIFYNVILFILFVGFVSFQSKFLRTVCLSLV